MGRTMSVVIFAQEADAPVDLVVRELSQLQVPVFRADTRWFPRDLVLDAQLVDGRWSGTLSTEHRTVDLTDVRSIWYRDPSAFDLPPELTGPTRTARPGSGSAVCSLPCLRCG